MNTGHGFTRMNTNHVGTAASAVRPSKARLLPRQFKIQFVTVTPERGCNYEM